MSVSASTDTTPASVMTFAARYRGLVAELERRFPVAQWRCGDLDLWPLARCSLYLDMYWCSFGPAPRAERATWLPLRIASRLLRPLTNLWHGRHDLRGLLLWPRRADVAFLGDGVSLDYVNGQWRDRFGEPVLAMLERRGRSTFLMQGGGLQRRPWLRPAFLANLAEAWGWLLSARLAAPLQLPGHDELLRFLSEAGVAAPSLARPALSRRAAEVAGSATVFAWILRIVRPRLAFVVNYYSGLGPAFVLACGRRGILCIDVQRAPLQGSPMAYEWLSLPAAGYSVLPDVFWCWTEEDVANVARWARAPRHRALWGGHTQLAVAPAGAPAVRWEGFEREILVALQAIGGHAAVWDALTDLIDAAPRGWRWWLRRHPAATTQQDALFGRLLSLRRENVIVAAACAPLHTLLPHMSVLVSLNSGAALEAELFGVPALFLSPEARATFAALLERGAAAVIDVRELGARIAALPKVRQAKALTASPALEPVLDALESLATVHAAAREAR
jgi:hypothetical protein